MNQKLWLFSFFYAILLLVVRPSYSNSIYSANLHSESYKTLKIKQNTISGVVTDENNEPLLGVTIQEKGTNNGTTTDFNGNYTLDVGNDAILVVSYLGYVTQEISVNGKTTINIQLIPDATQLEDVVVVGYGIQKKSDVTGSIASVSEKDFNKGVVANPGQLIQGKLPGVNVASVSGEPGANQNIIIRGAGSLRAGTTPLFVIDGFVIDNTNSALASNPLNFINPSDIEKIDVLKDASSTAIYGARAANGVVIITTKKGKEGKTEMNLSLTSAFASISNKIDVFTADQFREQVVAVGGILQDLGANTDWQDELLRTAFTKNVNFSMSGAKSDTFSYFIGTSLDDQEGIFENSTLKRYSARANLNQKALNGRFNVDFNLTASRIINERPNAGANTRDMLSLNPTFPADIEDQNQFNPNTRNEIFSDEANSNRILSNIRPSFEIVKGLTYKLNLGVDYTNTTRNIQQSPFPTITGLEQGFLNTINTINSNFLVETPFSTHLI
jgi:iron complex outermembrane receptor protein